MFQKEIYRCVPDGCGGHILLFVRKTKKPYILELVENTCRYSPGQVDMLFAKSNRVVINKEHNPHPVQCNSRKEVPDWFVIYPFQAGIFFLFEFSPQLDQYVRDTENEQNQMLY